MRMRRAPTNELPHWPKRASVQSDVVARANDMLLEAARLLDVQQQAMLESTASLEILLRGRTETTLDQEMEALRRRSEGIAKVAALQADTGSISRMPLRVSLSVRRLIGSSSKPGRFPASLS